MSLSNKKKALYFLISNYITKNVYEKIYAQHHKSSEKWKSKEAPELDLTRKQGMGLTGAAEFLTVTLGVVARRAPLTPW